MGLRSDAFARTGLPLDGYRPTRGRALVQRISQVQVGKVHLVEKKAEDKRLELTVARVIKTGPHELSATGVEMPFDFTSGDYVLLDRFAGNDVTLYAPDPDAPGKLKETEYVIVTRTDVLGVFNSLPDEFSGEASAKIVTRAGS